MRGGGRLGAAILPLLALLATGSVLTAFWVAGGSEPNQSQTPSYAVLVDVLGGGPKVVCDLDAPNGRYVGKSPDVRLCVVHLDRTGHRWKIWMATDRRNTWRQDEPAASPEGMYGDRRVVVSWW